MSIKWLPPVLSILPVGLFSFCVQASEPVALPTAEVERWTIPREYRLDGVVEAVHRATVSAQIHGQVESIHFDVHDYVEKDTLLMKIKDTEYQARLGQAEAELQSATAQLKQREEDFKRLKGMYQKKLISDSAMDQATADFKTAEGRYDAATAALAAAREQLGYAEIRAPYTGFVTERHVEVGEIAGPGKPVMSGISLDHLRVLIDVPQSVIPALKKSRKVRVQLPDGETLDVSDIMVYPVADSGSNSFKVRADLPEGTKQLFPGMFLKVSLITGQKDVLVVPESAVVKRSEVTGVYVVEGRDKVRFRQIRLGRDLGDHLVVLAGLDAGERTATDPYAAVLLRKRGNSARTHD
jgi:RND family efflux transporter MFP subunit